MSSLKARLPFLFVGWGRTYGTASAQTAAVLMALIAITLMKSLALMVALMMNFLLWLKVLVALKTNVLPWLEVLVALMRNALLWPTALAALETVLIMRQCPTAREDPLRLLLMTVQSMWFRTSWTCGSR